MFKHVGLSICLCLLAMGVNSVFAGQTATAAATQRRAQTVTFGDYLHGHIARPVTSRKK